MFNCYELPCVSFIAPLEKLPSDEWRKEDDAIRNATLRFPYTSRYFHTIYWSYYNGTRCCPKRYLLNAPYGWQQNGIFIN